MVDSIDPRLQSPSIFGFASEEPQRQMKKERERERESVCVCVCVGGERKVARPVTPMLRVAGDKLGENPGFRQDGQ